MTMRNPGRPGPPEAEGLYDPAREHDACGVAFVADIQGRRSNAVVRETLTAIRNLHHRGACGCEADTGDGAGILIQIPDGFFRQTTAPLDFDLPPEGDYGVGFVFLPIDRGDRGRCEMMLERAVREAGLSVIGWRDVPFDARAVGPTARAVMPVFRQIFVGRGKKTPPGDAFERRLYFARKIAVNMADRAEIVQRKWFYISSLSHRTIVYKGMLTSEQLAPFFPDLADPALECAIALAHSRFSTNTFPSWELAHPYRFIAHNGEINTLRGNINWMHARESLFETPHFPGEEMKRLLPALRAGLSDSAIFDHALEMLVMGGRSLPHAVMMLIPEPWQGRADMSDEKRAFYEYHSCLIEPWDGPALIAFTDGRIIGANLDRNGLRPARYWITDEDRLIFASEVGVLDIPPEKIVRKGRLEPGRMLLVDTEQGRIINDEELKRRIASEKPYRKWLDENLVDLDDLPDGPPPPLPDPGTLLVRQKAFGYTHEDIRILIAPTVTNAEEPIGSMGDDTPLAVLSDKPRPLFDYFKQLFAQVTNPPLDGIREALVTSIATTIGPEGNLLDARPEYAQQVRLASPILSNDEMAKLRALSTSDTHFRSRVLSMTYPAAEDGPGLAKAMERLCEEASRAVADGVRFLILSDRGIDAANAPIPSLLATSGVHHHLVRRGERTRVSLVVETGEPREVHHFCLLLGYGGGAINPYLVFETIDDLIRAGVVAEPSQAAAPLDHKAAVGRYVKAINKGILKVISKMGISTIQSYRGAQVFEAVGLDRSVIDEYFTWTPSRIGGVDLASIARETEARLRTAFPARPASEPALDAGGKYQWRRDGERHLFSPETIHHLQASCRSGDYARFKKYSALVDDQARGLCTLRGLFDFKEREPVTIDEVEPVEEIVKRFATGAMSYGSISQEAHETLAIAMNRLGGKSNTGEGGEDEERFSPLPNGDSRNSAVKQVASGRFGVTSAYLVSAKELQIKMAQGAKPGEGGQLPARKVYPWIAKTRHSTPFVGLISPPPHHDIYSIEDLAQLIHDLKNANSKARIAVKLVAEVGVGTVAAGVAKAKADVVLISGHDGGTGASPLTSIKHAGIPWELGLAETQQTLVMNGLRDRIVVQTDGQLKTGRDVAIAALLGAEEFGFATAPLVSMGCVMMRVCHMDTCPVGVATQNPELRKRFTGKPEHVENFMRFVAQELREIMAKLGFRRLEEMIGRSDLLETRPAVAHWKARGLDFTEVFHRPAEAERSPTHRVTQQDHGLDKALDNLLVDLCRDALDEGKPVSFALPIRNTRRTVGAMLGAELTRRHGTRGLPDETIRIHFRGSAGQSFGAFLPRGISLLLEGDSNDYLGKGLSGGKIAVVPPRESRFAAEENVVAGNVLLYGATSGECYLRGRVGERFCVRNSGAWAVVEGAGDHACEYMTGGRVLVLGPTGRNFAAGMSGGIAYVRDASGDFFERVNREMVDIDPLEEDDLATIRTLLVRHLAATGSIPARDLLADFDAGLERIVKVMPKEYKRALAEEAARRNAAVAAQA